MSTEIQCPQCRTPNPAGSKFCNKCGEPLPVDAPLPCAQCGAENPPHLLYCDRCGARLIAEAGPPEPEEPPESGTFEGFSLPARPPGETGDLDIDHIPEWLRTGHVNVTGESAAGGAAEEDDEADSDASGDEAEGERVIDDWLADLNEQDETLPTWLAADDALLQGGGEDAAPPQPDSAGEEPSLEPDEPPLPTWLREQTGALAEPAAQVEDAAEDGSEPDLSGMTSFPEGGPAEEAEAEEEDAPESAVDLTGFTHWLEELHSVEPPPDARASAGESEEEEAEPLPDQAPDGEEEEVAAPPEVPQEEAAPAEPEAWLAELESVSPPAEIDDEDWLAALDKGIQPGAEDSAEEEAWLSALDADVESAAQEEAGEGEPETDDEPDTGAETWLAELDAAGDAPEPDTPEAVAEEEEWLAELDAAGDAPEPDTPEAVAEEEEWLAQLDAARDAPELDTAQELADEDDWFEQLGGAADPGTAAEGEPDSGEQRPATEAWEEAPEPDAVTEEPAAGVDEVLPGWMDELAAAAEDEKETDAAKRGSDEGMPAWLGEMLPDDIRGELQTGESALETPEAPLEEEGRSARRFSHWLSQEAGDEVEGVEAPQAQASEEDVDVSYDDMPEWLQPEEDDFESALEAALAVQGSEMLPSMGEDWLDLLSDVPEERDVPPREALEPAEIPAWLSDLQPSAGSAVAPPPLPEETTGPLAGLRGVIDIEPVIALPRQSAPRGSLVASREQKQQAALLQRLAQAESTRPPLVARERPAALPVWLRWTLGLLLLAAVAAGLLFGEGVLGTVAPPPLPAGAAALQETIAATEGSTVLVAFDYTPALHGELSPQAELLLQQLAAGDNRFVTVSQSAAGAALARESIPGATALGYLPGESIGLRQLANCLPALAECENLIGRPLPAGTGNIGLVVLLTGERDSFTAWLEQVDAQTDSLPFVAAVTESVAPVANPYYDSGQLDGLLSGLPAAAAYESAYGGEGEVLRLYQARGLASWLAITLLVVGNVVFLLTWRTSENRRRRQQTKPIPTEGT